MRRFLAVGSSALLALVVACSSSSSPDHPTGSSSGAEGSPTGSSGAAKAPSGGGGGTGGASGASDGDASDAGGGGSCAGEATVDACYGCCDKASPKAADVLNEAFGKCVCEVGKACKSECAATFCAGKDPDDACGKCLDSQQADVCSSDAEAACNADASCAPYLACTTSAKCDDKPEQ